MADDLEELTGGLRRMWSTASLATKLGAKAASRVWFKSKVDPDAALANSSAAVEAATKLVDKMGQLKGLVMKAGQIASYMPGSLPPAAQEVMARLQAQSTPMSFAKISEVLAAETIGPFDAIEETPFAAASIGQVHRATWNGTRVAVKVQYPGIESAIRSDLKTVGVIARMGYVGTPVDGGALARELHDRLIEECDYVREADNQRRFTELLAHVPGASVPAVIAERSSRRVLTTVLSEARPLTELGDQLARDRVGHTIFRACFELLWHRCIYNADPHPGNYLASPTGDVTFLDFGCVRRFEPEMIRTWKLFARAVLDHDHAAFKTHFTTLGFVGKAKGFDWDYQMAATRDLYKPFLVPGYRFNPADVSKSFGTLMFDNPNKFKIAMPPAWLFLNRLQWGLNAVLAQLSATGPWRDTIEELLAMPLAPA